MVEALVCRREVQIRQDRVRLMVGSNGCIEIGHGLGIHSSIGSNQ
jgi:hypothetical protein